MQSEFALTDRQPLHLKVQQGPAISIPFPSRTSTAHACRTCLTRLHSIDQSRQACYHSITSICWLYHLASYPRSLDDNMIMTVITTSMFPLLSFPMSGHQQNDHLWSRFQDWTSTWSVRIRSAWHL